MSVQIKPLLNLSLIEAPPKYLQSLEDAGTFVKRLKETDPDIVNSTANRSGTDEERRALQAGLLYLALTEPDPRRSACTDIVLTARDNLNYALSELTRLVAEAWPKMGQPVRVNLLAILAELIATRGASVEVLMLHLYRRMPTGDLSGSNIWLIETVINLLIRNKEWLESSDRQPFLLPLTVYTILRLVPDHYNMPNSTTNPKSDAVSNTQPSLVDTLSALRSKESSLVSDLIRKNFDKCAQLGRDMIRMLHIVSQFSPFQRLWQDILADLSSISCHHKNITSVLDIITPQFFVQTLIPHEMEQWIRWMLRNVHCVPGFPVRRYQEFFHRKFFSTTESQSLRVCLTRYIVNYFYPDNEMLASSLIPRWNVISWLISQSVCPVANYNIKMALFFDWLFFKPNDCIMNVEPAILAITNNLSIRSQPFALALVDFLTKAAANFHPPLADRIATSIRAGLEDMLRLGVIRSLNPLLDSLLRASPDIYRNFNTLIGPLIDSSVLPPPSTTPGAFSGMAVVTVATSLPSETKISTIVSLDPDYRPLNRPGTPPLITGGKVSRDKAAVTAVLSSAPTDPRLRRSANALTIKSNALKNGGTVIQSCKLGGDEVTFSGGSAIVSHSVSTISHGAQKSVGGRPPSPPDVIPSVPFSPPPVSNMVSQVPQALAVVQPPVPLPIDPLSPDDLKELLLPVNSLISNFNTCDANNAADPVESAKRASTNEVAQSKTREAKLACKSYPNSLSSTFNSLASPEYRLTTSSDSVQQRIDDLRRKFQAYQFQFNYDVDTNIDVRSLIGQLDDPIRSALEALVESAKGAGLYDEAKEESAQNSDCSSSSHHDADDAAMADMCEAMQNVVLAVLAENCFDDLEIAGRTAAVICQACLHLFGSAPARTTDISVVTAVTETGTDMEVANRGLHNRRSNQTAAGSLSDRLPSQFPITEEQIVDSLASPVFVPLRHLCEMSLGDPKRELLLLLLTEMQARQPRVGYHLLYFLTVGINDEKMTAYRNFCASQENPNLVASLYRDVQLLADDNRFLFCYLLPTVYCVFANELANDSEFIRLIVRKIDPSQANYLVCEILRGHLSFFNRTNITEILKASLEWTSMEQFFFWQLVNAHELPTRNFLPLIPLVDSQKHPEACLHLLLLLQLEKPTNEVVRLLLSRSFISGMNSTAADDLLSVTALHYWGCPGRQHAQRFASILGNMVNSAVANLRSGTGDRENQQSDVTAVAATRDKKRNGVRSGSSESLNQLVSILSHLDCMRKKCKNIAMLEATELQSTLQLVIHTPGVPVGVKDRFAELLTLVEDDTGELSVSDSLSGGSVTGVTRLPLGQTRSSRQEESRTSGSKGGHSLRNLDSRRAAEAERRRNAVATGSTLKKSRASPESRIDKEQHSSDSSDNDSNGEDSAAESESILAVATDDDEAEEEEDEEDARQSRGTKTKAPSSSSSDVDEESVEDEDELPLKRRKELLTRNTGNSIGTSRKRAFPGKSELSGRRRPMKKSNATGKRGGAAGRGGLVSNRLAASNAASSEDGDEDEEGDDEEDEAGGEENALSDSGAADYEEQGLTAASSRGRKLRQQQQPLPPVNASRKSRSGGGLADITDENGPDSTKVMELCLPTDANVDTPLSSFRPAKRKPIARKSLVDD